MIHYKRGYEHGEVQYMLPHRNNDETKKIGIRIVKPAPSTGISIPRHGQLLDPLSLICINNQ